MKTNDLVKYTSPMEDEIGMTFKVIEVNGDRVIMEAQNGMNILPTCVAQISDLTIITFERKVHSHLVDQRGPRNEKVISGFRRSTRSTK